MVRVPRLAIRPRDLGLAALAVVIGCGIAALDSRPGWDDAGITAGLLVLGAAIVGALDGRRPWPWAVLVGAPLPIVELPSVGAASGAPLVALLFAAIGASFGVMIRRVARPGGQGPAEASRPVRPEPPG